MATTKARMPDATIGRPRAAGASIGRPSMSPSLTPLSGATSLGVPSVNPGITPAMMHQTAPVGVRFDEIDYITYAGMSYPPPLTGTAFGQNPQVFEDTALDTDVTDPIGLSLLSAASGAVRVGAGYQFEVRAGLWVLDSNSSLAFQFLSSTSDFNDHKSPQRLHLDLITDPVPLDPWVNLPGSGANPDNPWNQTRAEVAQYDPTPEELDASTVFSIPIPEASFGLINAVIADPSFNDVLGFLLWNETLSAIEGQGFFYISANSNLGNLDDIPQLVITQGLA